MGESEAALMRQLHDEHAAALWSFCMRLTGQDGARAEDVVQETLLRAWRNADKLTEDRGSVRGWLLTVARNVVTDTVRARRARPTEVAAEGHEPPVRRDHADDVVNSVYVSTALAQLSQEHQQVLRAVYFGRRTATEAADELGVAVGTVKSRTYYALRALRDALSEGQEVRA
jgi:RNA polymerase sigma-70 factor (ECF subfamily)